MVGVFWLILPDSGMMAGFAVSLSHLVFDGIGDMGLHGATPNKMHDQFRVIHLYI